MPPPFFGYPVLGCGFYSHKVAYPKKGYDISLQVFLLPKSMKSMVVGTRDFKCWVLGPSGIDFGSRGPRRRRVEVSVRRV